MGYHVQGLAVVMATWLWRGSNSQSQGAVRHGGQKVETGPQPQRWVRDRICDGHPSWARPGYLGPLPVAWELGYMVQVGYMVPSP